MTTNSIYVDHAATTPVHPLVVEAMLPFFKEQFGNPSSIHRFGREGRSALNQARKRIAHTLSVDTKEVVFTSGGTEADNLAIMGTALARQGEGKHIITSSVEHHAVLYTCQRLEENGFRVTYLPVDEYGQVQVEDVQNAIEDDTILLTLMYGNNETGTLQPIREVGRIARENGIRFHTDAVQALGIEELNLERLPVDLLSLSGHKINAPKGVGCLYVKSGIDLQPLVYGGAQERNKRAGTENMAGIAGLAKAIELVAENRSTKGNEYEQLRRKLIEKLDEQGVEYQINGHPSEYLPHILNLSFPGVKAETMLMNLDLEGIAASSGSACTAGSLQLSHVLMAMYAEGDERVRTAIRFSFGMGNTPQQMLDTGQAIARIVNRIKRK